MSMIWGTGKSESAALLPAAVPNGKMSGTLRRDSRRRGTCFATGAPGPRETASCPGRKAGSAVKVEYGPGNGRRARGDEGTAISMAAGDAVREGMAARRGSKERSTAIAVLMDAIFGNLRAMGDGGYEKRLVDEPPRAGARWSGGRWHWAWPSAALARSPCDMRWDS